MRTRRWGQRLAERSAVLPRVDVVSLCALLGGTVRNPDGDEAGRLVDVVVDVDEGDHPLVKGIVMRVGRRRVFVHVDQIAAFRPDNIRLSSARLTLEDVHRRHGEASLAEDVLDHQLVDVDGARVVRAADLYLLETDGGIRLVGVDATFTRLLGRVGPRRLLGRRRPSRVIDWAAIEWLGEHAQPVRLRRAAGALHRLRPAELADLVEELGRTERHQLLAGLAPATAADVLEEMEPDAVEAVLRETPVERAAELLAGMAPDEAVDALRDLPGPTRDSLVRALPEDKAAELVGLLSFPERAAGGSMTPLLVLATTYEHVGDVVARLREVAEPAEIDAVVVVDEDHVLVDDVPLHRLLVAGPDAALDTIVSADLPVTVQPDTPLRDLVESFVASRRSSVLVVDAERHPLGRVLADDVIDALVEQSERADFLRRRPRT